MKRPNEKLEAARMQRRWSVAVASKKVGVSVNTFNRWERGLQVPQLGTLDLLCTAFGLSPEELGFERSITIKRRRAKSPFSQQPLPATPASPPAKGTFVSMTADLSYTGNASLFRAQRDPLDPYDFTQFQQQSILEDCTQQAQRSLAHMSLLHQKRTSGIGLSRRQAINTLIGVPAIMLGITQNEQIEGNSPQEQLAKSAVTIPFAWQLYFKGEFEKVIAILPDYLAQLGDLVERSGSHQRKAAYMASQCYQLASLLTLQYQNYGTSLIYARKAFDYGQQLQDPNLQVTSLIRQAQVHLYLKHPQQRLATYERAAQHIKAISPLLQGRLYIGLTEAHSALGHVDAAHHFRDAAHAIFPERHEEDPNFSYTHFNRWSLSALEGLMYMNLKQTKQAWEAFALADRSVPQEPVSNRVELTVRQAEAAFDLGDLERSAVYIRRAATAARQAGNQLRHGETYQVYERMQSRWGQEQAVKDLHELFDQHMHGFQHSF